MLHGWFLIRCGSRLLPISPIRPIGPIGPIRLPDAAFRKQDACATFNSRLLTSVCSLLDIGYSAPAVKTWTLDISRLAGSRFTGPDIEYSAPAVKTWTLDIPCWLLDILPPCGIPHGGTGYCIFRFILVPFPVPF